VRLGTELSERLSPAPAAATLDPIGWIEERLGEKPWSKQREIAQSIVDHRYTAVPSGHGIGKSYLGARLAAWWIATHAIGDAFVVTTAPTGPQVEAVVWREISRAHAKGGLPGRITAGAVPMWKVGAEMVAYGRKPQDLLDPEQAAAAFQGIHARFVLVILDEAAGISPWLWDAVDSLVTNRNGRVLAIGNPTDPASEFAKKCAPGSGWHVLPVSVFDTPTFTGERATRELLELLPSAEWVEERKRRWGEASPLYIAKVLGRFPGEAEDLLITPAMVREAQDQELPGDGAARVGVDVARAGSDETVGYVNRGGRVRIVHQARGADTMRTTGAVAQLLKANPEDMQAVVDIVGVGAGVFDRLREQGLAVLQFQASERAGQPERFANRRAESYWLLREAFRSGEIDLDPDDEELASQLQSIRWFVNSRGQTQIESKDDMRKRGLPSPDRADAVAMSIGPINRGLPVMERDWGPKTALERLEESAPLGPDANFLEVAW
jgi:hypothetical protein